MAFDLWQAPGEKAPTHVLLHYSLSVIHFHYTVTDLQYGTHGAAEVQHVL